MKRKIEDSITSDREVPNKKAALDEATEDGHSSSKNTSLYRPPTREEINTLKETENLFKSSLFRMQITELLAEVQPKKPKNKALDKLLHDLNTFLKSLSRGKEHDLSDISWLPKKVKFPLPPTPSAVKGKFRFSAPSALNVIGSYMLGTLTKPDYSVDVTMEMPQECFQPKDYLNMRYHHKRAIYLTIVASKLIKSKMFASVNFMHFKGQLLKPILLLKPKGKVGKNYTIKLYPVLPDGVFKPQRFSPDKNNIRLHWFEGRENDGEEGDIGPPTPHYNTSILSDSLMGSHLHHLYQCITDCPSIRDAIILINIWLKQRELSRGQGAFGSFLVAMVVTHLFTSRKINVHMSSYQILRIFLQFIGSTNWTETGIQMRKDQNNDKLPLLSDFHSAFDVVFIDPSGYLNLCANLSKHTYFRVKHEAKLAMEFLDSRCLDAFEVMFMRKAPFIQSFDQYFCLSSVNCLKDVKEKPELQAQLLSRAGDWVPAVSDWTIDLLKKALGKRVELLGVQARAPKQWSIKESPPSLPCDGMMIGLLLDPNHSDGVLDTGPPADDPQAGQFRAFWGGKSELRRFQDGSILEAVVWPCKSIAERRVICGHIIKHVLQRHCKIDPSEVHFIANQLDPILQVSTTKTSTPTKDKSPGSQVANAMETGEENMQLVMTAYDSLCKQIRSLELPLAVHSLQGISSVFRGAEVHPPHPCHKNAFRPKQQESSDKENGTTVSMATNISVPKSTRAPLWCPVAEVLLQFETSGKWPDDLVVIQHIKAAFHVQLAELLSSKFSLQCVATSKHVDVLKDGFGFRVKIAHYREMVLLQQSLSSEENEERATKEKLSKMEREIVHLPVLTTTLHSVEQQFNAYSGTVRLAKRWVSAHLLSSHMPLECIELLVAYLFLSPAPFKPPRSPLIGFLRFLYFVSTCDWKTTPVIVNLNSDLTAEDYQDISSKFSSGRSQLPALFISTPKDKLDSKWTKEAPTKQVLNRLEVLAKESYSVLLNQFDKLSSQETDFKQIFRPPMTDFDVIIWLKHHCIPRHYQSIDVVNTQDVKHKEQQGSGMPVMAFDPVQFYVTELKESFSDIALFFHDEMGGDFIAVVWMPQAFEKSPFKVLNAQYKAPVEEESKKAKNLQNVVAPNIEAILEDFSLLGKGLVKRVEVIKKTTSNGNTINQAD